MAATSYALFETVIGCCGIVWAERGIVAVQLPECSAASIQTRIRERFVEALQCEPTPMIERAIKKVIALLAGKKVDFSVYYPRL